MNRARKEGWTVNRAFGRHERGADHCVRRCVWKGGRIAQTSQTPLTIDSQFMMQQYDWVRKRGSTGTGTGTPEDACGCGRHSHPPRNDPTQHTQSTPGRRSSSSSQSTVVVAVHAACGSCQCYRHAQGPYSTTHSSSRATFG